MDRYQILEDLKEWLGKESVKELLAPSSCLAVLNKIDELECEHE